LFFLLPTRFLSTTTGFWSASIAGLCQLKIATFGLARLAFMIAGAIGRIGVFDSGFVAWVNEDKLTRVGGL
jgi:hypothetical protein